MTTIVFDFDGVLCEYQKWKGHDSFGAPIQEMIEYVKELHNKKYTLKLSTTRLNPKPFDKYKQDHDVVSGYAFKCLYGYLEKHNIANCFDTITGYKPYGDYYIDDKALRYNSSRYPDSDTDMSLIDIKKTIECRYGLK